MESDRRSHPSISKILQSSYPILAIEFRKSSYWYYKLQADKPTFTKTTTVESLSKYKHLGSSGSQAHVDGVMGVVRRTIVSELQKTIDSLKDSLLDVSFDGEQEDK